MSSVNTARTPVSVRRMSSCGSPASAALLWLVSHRLVKTSTSVQHGNVLCIYSSAVTVVRKHGIFVIRPAPHGTPEALPYPILRRMSNTRHSHVAPAAPCFAWLWGALSRQPRHAGCAARAVGKAWPLAGGAGERAAGASAQCCLCFLSVSWARKTSLLGVLVALGPLPG